MMHESRRVVTSLLLAIAALMWGRTTAPSLSIRTSASPSSFPFGAGGSNDILARAIGQKLSENWRVPVIVENVAGASGSLGAARAAKAEPDGHTLLILSSTYTINSAVQPVLPYDPKTSFSAVAMT